MSSNPCHIGYPNERNTEGRCCCNCEYQQPITAHPWNTDEFCKGPVTKVIAWGCCCPEFFPHITLFQKEHGMCECHTFRKWKNPNE